MPIEDSDQPTHLRSLIIGADPGILERGFIIMYKGMCVCGGSLLSHMSYTETKLFHFHRIFKNRGWGGGLNEPPEPPLDSPLD